MTVRPDAPALRTVWDAMEPDQRDMLRGIRRSLATSQREISIDTLVSLWESQKPPHGTAALCAYTGVEFELIGPFSPRVARLNSRHGFTTDNTVLCCAAFYAMLSFCDWNVAEAIEVCQRAEQLHWQCEVNKLEYPVLWATAPSLKEEDNASHDNQNAGDNTDASSFTLRLGTPGDSEPR